MTGYKKKFEWLDIDDIQKSSNKVQFFFITLGC